jgi:hypothetical protein
MCIPAIEENRGVVVSSNGSLQCFVWLPPLQCGGGLGRGQTARAPA